MTKLKDEMLQKMKNGDIGAIMEAANSNNPFWQLHSIINGTRIGLKSDEYIELIKNEFMHSEAKFLGMRMSYFAEAALDILGIEKYTGEDSTVKNLIKSKMNFE